MHILLAFLSEIDSEINSDILFTQVQGSEPYSLEAVPASKKHFGCGLIEQMPELEQS